MTEAGARKPAEHAATNKSIRVDLVDHGPVYGIEVQFLDPVNLLFTHRFDPVPHDARAALASGLAAG